MPNNISLEKVYVHIDTGQRVRPFRYHKHTRSYLCDVGNGNEKWISEDKLCDEYYPVSEQTTNTKRGL